MTLDLKGKRVLVVGAGRSGAAAARYLHAQGATVLVNDAKRTKELGAVAAELKLLGCELHLGGHTGDIVSGCDLLVLSPGVPPAIGPVQQADAHGIPVISELELAARMVTTPIIAITGTNGKSTVTELVGRMLEVDHKVFIGGNLGRPAVEACGAQYDKIVLEISSFQLERAPSFHPNIAAILNITEDHLDRYSSFAQYKNEKLKIFSRQSHGDRLVINRQDPVLAAITPPTGCRVYGFALGPVAGTGAGLDVTDLVWQFDGGEVIRYPLERLQLQGIHNIENVLAAGLLARLAGASSAAITKVLDTFTGLSHRMQIVREVAGMTFIDDSKATNVGSAVASLASLPDGQVIWIAGGRDKGGDYAPLIPVVKKKSATFCCWERHVKKSRRFCRKRFNFTTSQPWKMRSGLRSSLGSREITSCWRRPAPVSICSATTVIGETFL